MSEIDIFKVEVSDYTNCFFTKHINNINVRPYHIYNNKIIIIPKLKIDLLYLHKEKDIIPKFNKYDIEPYHHVNNVFYYYIKIEPNIQKMLTNDDEYARRISTHLILNKLNLKL